LILKLPKILKDGWWFGSITSDNLGGQQTDSEITVSLKEN
jgi:hypothetical protein